MSKIAVLTSGGVDSSVALKLLKDEGHDVTAFYIKIWLEDEFQSLGECPWQEDLDYVRQVASKIDVPIEVVSLQRDYWDKVISYAIDEIKSGHTPNSDMMCNSKIKFGEFINHIDNSYEYVATGHYANKVIVDGKSYLKMGPDAIKDQTYFLGRLTSSQIDKALFPVGNLEKTQVRELAEKFDLANKNRKDSQGICFLGKISYHDFVKFNLGTKQGKLIDYRTKNCLGAHDGHWFYTIGQRHGIGLSNGPWYVVEKDVEDNVVYVSKKRIKNRSFSVKNIHWMNREPKEKENLKMKIRHGATVYNVRLDNNKVIFLNKIDDAVASGQFAVFYTEDNIVLGSGVIV